MNNLKLISEDRLDELIARCQGFIDNAKANPHPGQEDLRFLLIMEGQLLAYKMIKEMELKPLIESE